MITEKNLEEFILAQATYEQEKSIMQKRFREVACAVGDLKVWRREDIDYYNEGDGQVSQDGIGCETVGFGVSGKQAWLDHWDRNPMQHAPTMRIYFKKEYLFDDELFQKEICKPLKVLDDKQKAEWAKRAAESKARQEERDRKELERLKAQYEKE